MACGRNGWTTVSPTKLQKYLWNDMYSAACWCSSSIGGSKQPKQAATNAVSLQTYRRPRRRRIAMEDRNMVMKPTIGFFLLEAKRPLPNLSLMPNLADMSNTIGCGLRYWYWVILGCYWKLVLGIVKAFLQNWYWYWVLLKPFCKIGIGIGYC